VKWLFFADLEEPDPGRGGGGFRRPRQNTFVGSFLRLIDSCITQLKAQGPSTLAQISKDQILAAAAEASESQAPKNM